MRWVSRDIDEIGLDHERLQCGPSSTGTTSTAATEATPPPPTRCCSPRRHPHLREGPGPGLWRGRQRPGTRRARPARHRHPHHSPGYRQCPGQCLRPRPPGARRMGRGGLRLGRGRRPGHPPAGGAGATPVRRQYRPPAPRDAVCHGLVESRTDEQGEASGKWAERRRTAAGAARECWKPRRLISGQGHGPQERAGA